MHGRNEWKGFVRGECLGCILRDEHSALTIYHSYWLLQLYEAFMGVGSFFVTTART